MNAYERRQQFDQLYRLRTIYRLRNERDNLSSISIESVIEHAERLLADPDLLVEALGPDAFEPERRHA